MYIRFKIYHIKINEHKCQERQILLCQFFSQVEGGSGDGIVTSRGGAQNSQQLIRQELYEEIPSRSS